MAAPKHTPAQRKPHHFDPLKLASSVIALPLLEELQREIARTELIKKSYPDFWTNHNAAIFLREGYPGGPAAALKAVRDILAELSGGPETEPKHSIDDPDPSISEWIALATLDDALIRDLIGHDTFHHRPPAIEHIWPAHFDVVIDINLDFRPLIDAPSRSTDPDPRRAAKKHIRQSIDEAKARVNVSDCSQRVDDYKTQLSNQYVFARLEAKVIQALVEIDREHAEQMSKKWARAKPAAGKVRKGKASVPAAAISEDRNFRTIHHIWPDFQIGSCTTKSIVTIKADAAQRSFSAYGSGITWAVMDTGIDAEHPHFKLHGNIDPASAYHADFTGLPGGPMPLKDEFGHGTHVAGIIAGEQSIEKKSDPKEMIAVWRELDTEGNPATKQTRLDAISGVAPQCQLVSLKVLDKFGQGKASNVIAAIAHVQQLNGHGRDLKIHGVNLSLGHPFDPKWFGCGRSPLCVEINRLAKSGVVVVVAAGNTGYGTLVTAEGESDACLDLTINDPGNAEGAITVGSTHRTMPHKYGVSYFSSKGPTGDGRSKPDLLAPGEKIISCATKGSRLVDREAGDSDCSYFENSGTSMSAPHVSGAIAAFLSIRPEFIGETERIKQIFTSSATDLGRDRYFQGAGLIDLMRAIQSI